MKIIVNFFCVHNPHLCLASPSLFPHGKNKKLLRSSKFFPEGKGRAIARQIRELCLLVGIGITCNSSAVLATVSTTSRDADQPMTIRSKAAEFDDEKSVAIYKGNVMAIQGSRLLNCTNLTIHRNKNNKIGLVLATGNPAKFYAQPNTNKPNGIGTANIIKYFPEEDKVILLGNATLEQDGDAISGELLTYYFEKGLLISEKTTPSRTTVVLQPK